MLKTFVIDLDYRLTLIFLSVLLGISGFDIVVDLSSGIPVNHVLHEMLTVLICLIIIFFQLRTQYLKNLELKKITLELNDLVRLREEFKNQTSSYADQFSLAVKDQFSKWHLTQSEVDIATLLIKGFSMKEIAGLRNSQESTVRQQATSIYKKSGLGGRQQLAAFFLEDIF